MAPTIDGRTIATGKAALWKLAISCSVIDFVRVYAFTWPVWRRYAAACRPCAVRPTYRVFLSFSKPLCEALNQL